MQIREILLLIDQESAMISQKACGLINQVIKKALQDRKFGDILLEDVNLGHGTQGTSDSKRAVSVL